MSATAVVEEISDHAWAWADVLAWMAGTLGEVLSVTAERLFKLEQTLKPH